MDSSVFDFLFTLNKHELLFFFNFYKLHNNKTPSEFFQLLEAENPELYDKILKYFKEKNYDL